MVDPELKDRLNKWSNQIFEQASEIDPLDDDTLDDAVQRLAEAADHLSRLTYTE